MHFTIIVALNSSICRINRIEQIEEPICTTLVSHLKHYVSGFVGSFRRICRLKVYSALWMVGSAGSTAARGGSFHVSRYDNQPFSVRKRSSLLFLRNDASFFKIGLGLGEAL